MSNEKQLDLFEELSLTDGEDIHTVIREGRNNIGINIAVGNNFELSLSQYEIDNSEVDIDKLVSLAKDAAVILFKESNNIPEREEVISTIDKFLEYEHVPVYGRDGRLHEKPVLQCNELGDGLKEIQLNFKNNKSKNKTFNKDFFLVFQPEVESISLFHTYPGEEHEDERYPIVRLNIKVEGADESFS